MDKKEKKDIKDFRIRKILLPLLLYYVMGLLAQLLFCIREMPGMIKTFVLENAGLFQGDMDMFEGISDGEAIVLFSENFTEEIYWEFLYTFAMRLVEMSGLLTVLAAAIAVPLLAFIMWRDRSRENVKIKKEYPTYSVFWVLLGSITLCIGLNCIISLSGLMEIDTDYETTSQMLYSIPVWLQILGLGVVIPLVEEILYRGIIYKRLEQYFKTWHAIVISAIIFAFVHGNMVQFIYAFICGIVFAWLYEEFGAFRVPFIAHCMMNLTSVLGSSTDFFYKLSERIEIASVLFITLTSVFYVLIINSKRETIPVN